RGDAERHPGRDAPAARRPQRVRPRIRHPCARRDQAHRDVRADAAGEIREGTHFRLRKTHRVSCGLREAPRPRGRGGAGTGRGPREADQGLRRGAIPAPAMLLTSSGSLPRLAPSRTATIGMTNAMYERNVACISFRSHCHATNVTTEPAIARYRIAPRPWGHVGTAHGSRAMRERPARAPAPTAMDAALKLIGSVSWPQRFTATVANAAHVAPRTIDNLGNTCARPAVPSWLREMRTPRAKPTAIPRNF